jgi:hypothetical protein
MLKTSLGVNEYNAFTQLPSNVFDNSSKLTVSSIKHGFIQTTLSRLTVGQANQIAVFNISFDLGAYSYILETQVFHDQNLTFFEEFRRCFELKISSRSSYELRGLGNLFCEIFPRLRTLNINSGSPGIDIRSKRNKR